MSTTLLPINPRVRVPTDIYGYVNVLRELGPAWRGTGFHG